MERGDTKANPRRLQIRSYDPIEVELVDGGEPRFSPTDVVVIADPHGGTVTEARVGDVLPEDLRTPPLIVDLGGGGELAHCIAPDTPVGELTLEQLVEALLPMILGRLKQVGESSRTEARDTRQEAQQTPREELDLPRSATIGEACKLLRFSRSTFDRRRTEHEDEWVEKEILFPLGSRYRVDVAALDTWFRSRGKRVRRKAKKSSSKPKRSTASRFRTAIAKWVREGCSNEEMLKKARSGEGGKAFRGTTTDFAREVRSIRRELARPTRGERHGAA